MKATHGARQERSSLRAGDVVEVRSRSEILATLDERGELDALPFMPEMLQFCGQRFTVEARATKLCDTISWSGMRRMEDAVHLAGARCDGGGHGGCQASCMLYWKQAWLKRADDGAVAQAPAADPPLATTDTLAAAAEPEPGRYACQATELLRAAPRPVKPWDARQYVQDVTSGNAGLLRTVRSVVVGVFNEYQDLSRRFLPRPLRIKDQIISTLDTTNRNRGMTFDAEMLKYCGREATVLRRVERIIDEDSGKMLHFKNPCIVLEGVICSGDFHRVCPRSIYPYWREIWLERVR